MRKAINFTSKLFSLPTYQKDLKSIKKQLLNK